jgi:hypothetical protein
MLLYKSNPTYHIQAIYIDDTTKVYQLINKHRGAFLILRNQSFYLEQSSLIT